MSELEVVESIKQFADEHKKNGYSSNILANKDYALSNEKLSKIYVEFEKLKIDWKWHQFVRVALEPAEKRQYMYERTVFLLTNFGNRYQKYFSIKTETGLYHIPDEMTKINRLMILYSEFFEIYRNILSRIHFEYPKEEFHGNIKGKINWKKTIINSKQLFPIEFVSDVPKKYFNTPENVLLILSIKEMYRESKRILEIEFDEPLPDETVTKLLQIYNKCKQILNQFPFHEIVEESLKKQNIIFDPPSLEMKKIENDVLNRIVEKKIKNINYKKLLSWIEKYRDLSIKNLNKKSPTQNILESIKNVDTVYEIWIFMEFASFLQDKGVLINLNLRGKPHIEFKHKEHTIRFYYGKQYEITDKEVWAKPHDPDFIAILVDNVLGDQVLGVFDAKNYGIDSELDQPQDKILSYMNNFNTSLGGLFFPNYPKNWDEEHEKLWDEKRIENFFDRIVDRLLDENKINKQNLKNEIKNKSWKEIVNSKKNFQELSKIPDYSNEIIKITSKDEWNKHVMKNIKNQIKETYKKNGYKIFRFDKNEQEEFIKMCKKNMNQKWEQIDKKLKELFPYGIEIHNQQLTRKREFHNNQVVFYSRFSPREEYESIDMKKIGLEKIYQLLIDAIPKTLSIDT